MSKVRPLNDWILVQRREAVERTPGGIIVPEGARERPQEGEVLAVGPGRILPNGTRVAPEVFPGDVVIYGRHAAAQAAEAGAEAPVLIREEEILAVVPREAAC